MKTLNATLRTQTGKGSNRRLRAEGSMPAVVYGGEGGASSLSLSARELRALLIGAHRRNTLIGLEIDGAKAQPVLVSELQADPLTRELIHVDFVRVDLKQPLTVKVPVVLTGRAHGVLAGGRLRLVRREVKLSCLPEQIPSEFHVDVTPLDGGDSLRFTECDAPDGIEKVFRNDFVVVQCIKGREAKQAEAED